MTCRLRHFRRRSPASSPSSPAVAPRAAAPALVAPRRRPLPLGSARGAASHASTAAAGAVATVLGRQRRRGRAPGPGGGGGTMARLQAGVAARRHHAGALGPTAGLGAAATARGQLTAPAAAATPTAQALACRFRQRLHAALWCRLLEASLAEQWLLPALQRRRSAPRQRHHGCLSETARALVMNLHRGGPHCQTLC